MILLRALTIWIVLILAEIVHGVARAIILVPYVGEFRSSQIGVFSGMAIIFVIALAFDRWLGANRQLQLLSIGVLWLVLTLAFEFLFGHFIAGVSWDRIAADYDVLHGGLLPFGMLFLMFAPLLARKMRGRRHSSK
jgi:hypothetical protein